MDWKNLAVAILTPIVAFLLRAFFLLIGFEVDDGMLAALVAAIVAYLLSLVFQDAGAKAIHSFRN